MKIILILISFAIVSCSHTGVKTNSTDLKEQLAQVSTDDGLTPSEVSIIFANYRKACIFHTAFHVGEPALYNKVWVAPIYLGDIVPILSDMSLVLEPVKGKMFFSDSDKQVVSHFKNMYEECAESHADILRAHQLK